MKRVFIIHGWDGYPEEGWFPWLKTELERRGYSVTVPQMPEANKPRIFNWVPKIAEVVGRADEQTYFVGHSMGCQAIARYLESLPKGAQVGGVVYVAGFFKRLTGLEGDAEVQETDKHWLTTPLDFAKVKAASPKSVAIFSEDDPWVPLDNQDDYRGKLGSKIIIEKGKGHYSGVRDKAVDNAAALTALLELAAMPLITIADVAKLEIKMGTILTAEKIEGSDKLLKFTVDFGNETRIIVSGVAQHYAPEVMVGKQVPVIMNLAPRKLKGVESNGMILYAIDETDGGHKTVMLNPEKHIPNGSAVQ